MSVSNQDGVVQVVSRIRDPDLKVNYADICKNIKEIEKIETLKFQGIPMKPDLFVDFQTLLNKHKDNINNFICNYGFNFCSKDNIEETLNKIFGAFNEDSKLIKLDLSDNSIYACGFDLLANFLRRKCCKQLEVLILTHMKMDENNGKSLAYALQNRKLKVLNCSNNSLKTEGALAILDVLKHMGSLEEVKFSKNNITIKNKGEARRISDFLKSNKNLKNINFSFNCFKFGAEIIAEGLKTLKNLEAACFEQTFQNSNSSFLVFQSLDSSKNTLIEINFGYNDIDAAHGLDIIKLLKEFSNLKLVYLPGNRFSPSIKNLMKFIAFKRSNSKFALDLSDQLRLPAIPENDLNQC